MGAHQGSDERPSPRKLPPEPSTRLQAPKPATGAHFAPPRTKTRNWIPTRFPKCATSSGFRGPRGDEVTSDRHSEGGQSNGGINPRK